VPYSEWRHAPCRDECTKPVGRRRLLSEGAQETPAEIEFNIAYESVKEQADFLNPGVTAHVSARERK